MTKEAFLRRHRMDRLAEWTGRLFALSAIAAAVLLNFWMFR